MSKIREEFVKRFGVENAIAVQDAAEGHKNSVHDEYGSDPFRWALVIAVGYQCMERNSFRDAHGITAPWEEIDKWLVESQVLKDHDGDVDYLAMLAGKYDRYVGAEGEE